MKNFSIIFSFLTVLLISGCGTSRQGPVEPALLHGQITMEGYSVQGRGISYIRMGNGPRTVFMFASIHGNEPAGTGLVWRLYYTIQQNPEMIDGLTLLLMPAANPDGMAANERWNHTGVDLNRNFPAENRIEDERTGATALSEPESVILYDIINRYIPDIVIAFHQPLFCLDYDGPAEEYIACIAPSTHLPVRKLGARPGSMGSYVGLELGIPIITVEFERYDHFLSSDRLWEKYKDLLFAMLECSHI